jgi:hypothetical protein
VTRVGKNVYVTREEAEADLSMVSFFQPPFQPGGAFLSLAAEGEPLTFGQGYLPSYHMRLNTNLNARPRL